MQSLKHSAQRRHLCFRASRLSNPADNAMGDSSGSDAKVSELREGVRWQIVIANAVLTYMDTVPMVFKSLLEAQTVLSDAGISVVCGKGFDSTPFLQRFRQAAEDVFKVVDDLRMPIKTIRGTLDACVEDLNRADRAVAELKHYSDKLRALKAEDNHEDAARSSTLISRNQEKLQNSTDAAMLAKRRAEDLAQACGSRKDDLVESVGILISTVIEALALASGCGPSLKSSVTPPKSSSPEGSLVYHLSTSSHNLDTDSRADLHERCNASAVFEPAREPPILSETVAPWLVDDDLRESPRLNLTMHPGFVEVASQGVAAPDKITVSRPRARGDQEGIHTSASESMLLKSPGNRAGSMSSLKPSRDSPHSGSADSRSDVKPLRQFHAGVGRPALLQRSSTAEHLYRVDSAVPAARSIARCVPEVSRESHASGVDPASPCTNTMLL